MSALESLISHSGPSAEQQSARAVLARMGLPNRRLEDWKYLSLKHLENEALTAPVADFDGHASEYDIPGFNAARLVWVNGIFCAPLSDQVTGLTWSNQAQDLDWVSPELDGLAAANRAGAELMEIQVSPELVMPVHCLFLSIGEQQAAQPRLQWRVSANAQLEVLEQHAGPGANLVNMVSQFDLAADTKVTRYKLLNTTQATHTAHTHARVAKNADFQNHVIDLGGRFHRDQIKVELSEAHATTRLNGLYMVDGRYQSDSHTRIEHLVPQCTSAQHYRGIANGRGKAVFNGIVYIGKNASQSATEQKNANLLLSNKAEINPKPELQIHNDDVVASHGSTVGNLDDDQLFYLRQRGIGEDEGRALLTFAFAEQIAQALPCAPLAEYLEQRIAKNLPMDVL